MYVIRQFKRRCCYILYLFYFSVCLSIFSVISSFPQDLLLFYNNLMLHHIADWYNTLLPDYSIDYFILYKKGESFSIPLLYFILSLNKFQKIFINGFVLRSRHSVRETRVRNQFSVFQQFCRFNGRVFDGNNLIIFSVKNQNRNIYSF